MQCIRQSLGCTSFEQLWNVSVFFGQKTWMSKLFAVENGHRFVGVNQFDTWYDYHINDLL